MVKIEHAVIAGRQFKAAGLTPSALLSNKAIKEAVDCMNDEVLPIGTIAGLLFSILALVFYLPVFVLRRARPAPRVPFRGRPIVER